MIQVFFLVLAYLFVIIRLWSHNLRLEPQRFTKTHNFARTPQPCPLSTSRQQGYRFQAEEQLYRLILQTAKGMLLLAQPQRRLYRLYYSYTVPLTHVLTAQ